MAIVSDGFTLSVTLMASNSRKMSVRYDLVAANYADAVTATTTILAALADVSAGLVIGYNITAKAVDDAVTSVPTSDDAEFGEYAIITGQVVDNPLKTANIRIPMPKIGIFTAPLGINRDIVDIVDADVLTYVGLFDTGGVAYVSDGEQMDFILSGRRVK